MMHWISQQNLEAKYRDMSVREQQLERALLELHIMWAQEASKDVSDMRERLELLSASGAR